MDWSRIVEQSLSLITAVTAMLVPLAPLLVPLLSSQIKNAQHRHAFEAVSNACLIALNAAGQEYRRAVERAKSADSPGGSEVTRDEMNAAMAAGVSVGVTWLRDNKVYDQVIEVYGGEDAARLALESFIRAKL